MIERVKTGIEGFDKITLGGLLKNSVNLLSGGTGTGKTIFALQYLLNGARLFNERGLYISIEETEQELKADVEALGFNFSDVGDKIKFIYISPFNMEEFSSMLRTVVTQFKPQRVVIDSLTAVVMPLDDNFERKKEIFRIGEVLKKLSCTTLLLSEMAGENGGMNESAVYSRFGVESFLCDGVICLYSAGLGGEADRAIRVVKMRRTNHHRGPFPMTIGEGGITVLTES